MDILGGGLVGRPAQEIGKLFDVADILVVRLGAEPADRHVLDQSPAERTDGLVGHWGLLSWVRSTAPRSQDRTPASATPRDPSLATNYRGSGLVPRRILSVPARPGGGRLTERIPAIPPRLRERVKVPHTCRSQCPSGPAQLSGKRTLAPDLRQLESPKRVRQKIGTPIPSLIERQLYKLLPILVK